MGGIPLEAEPCSVFFWRPHIAMTRGIVWRFVRALAFIASVAKVVFGVEILLALGIGILCGPETFFV